MQTLPVNCNRCGATLDVGPDTRHVTCASCRTPLVVIRTMSSIFTDTAARQKELERIDREWEEEKQQKHMYTAKDGTRHTHNEMLEPLIAVAVIWGLVLLILVPFMISQGRWSSDAFLALLIVTSLAVAPLVYTIRKSRRYWGAKAKYEARRAEAEHRPFDLPE